MKKIGILYHPMKEGAYTFAQQIEHFLKFKGISVWLCSAWDTTKASTLVNDSDLLICIGGDGTILRAAHAAYLSETPIIGVNLGKLGFMTELRMEETMNSLPDILEGKGWIDERAMLEAEFSDGNSNETRKFYALNDVVVARGPIVRVINVQVSIGSEKLSNYKTDGIVMATATGSTGYSMAAGGPILYPQSKDYILLPLVPHLSLAFPLVLPSSAVAHLKVSTVNQAALSIDGHIQYPLYDGANVAVRHSTKTIKFLRLSSKHFYASLEERLKGKHQFV